MLNLVPQPASNPAPQAAPEAVLRLAILRKALLTGDEFGGGPAADFDFDELSADWTEASELDRRCVDLRSEAVMAVASAGSGWCRAKVRAATKSAPAALQLLADQIRTGVADIERLIRG